MKRFGNVKQLQKDYSNMIFSTNNKTRGIINVCFGFYFLAIISLTLSQPIRAITRSLFYSNNNLVFTIGKISNTVHSFRLIGQISLPFNLIPFKNFGNWLINYNPIALYNFIGNLILFIPLGFSLPIIFKRGKSFKINIIISLIIAIIIEALQYFLSQGVCDVNDVILYTIGSMIGFAIYKLLSHPSIKLPGFFKKITAS